MTVEFRFNPQRVAEIDNKSKKQGSQENVYLHEENK